MNIYYNYDKHNRTELTARCFTRLIEEAPGVYNIGEQIDANNINYYPLNEFDVNSGDYSCIEPMLEAGEVAYVLQPDESDEYVYVGRES